MQTCHRTQAVLRLLTLPHKRYASFVSGTDDGIREQGIVNAYLLNLLKKYERQIMETLEEVEAITPDDKPKTRPRRKSRVSEEDGVRVRVLKEQKDILLRRWKQIREIVNAAVRSLGG